MKIITRLYLILGSAILLLAMYACVCAVLVFSLRASIAKSELSREIIKGVFELNVLRAEYQLYYEDRAYGQWKTRHDSLTRTLDQAEGMFQYPEEKKYFLAIRSHLEWVRMLFFKLQKVYPREIDSTLRGQLLQHSQTCVSAASRLASISNQKKIVYIKALMTTTFIFLVLDFLIIIWSYRWVHSKVIYPIQRLQQGVRKISNGDLDRKVGLDSRDELGYLSHAFDESNERFKVELEARKKAESQLKRFNEKLEKRVLARTRELEISNRELEQFAHVSSHDLQEPLRTISNYVDLFIMTRKEKPDAESAEYLGHIQDGSLRALQLIRELLAYASIGGKEQTRKKSAMKTLLDQTLLNLKSLIEENHAEITADPLPDVEVNDVLMIQLFQNLISNAIKYKSEKSPKIHISARRESGSWIFSVKDNGIGVDPRYKEHIFMIFKRLHSSSRYSGTGIGLAVCKKIVQHHGGTIWVESSLGRGSVFYFSLPVEVFSPANV